MKSLPLILSLLFVSQAALAQFEPPPSMPAPEAKPVIDPLKIHFGCIFVDTTVTLDCADVEKNWREADPLLSFVPTSQAEFDVEMTEITDGAFEQYVLKITDHTGQLNPPTYILTSKAMRFSTSVTPASRMKLLVTALQGVMVPYHQIHDYKNDPNGQMLLTVAPKPGAKAPEALKKSPIYIQAAGFGMVIAQGNSINVMGVPTITAGYTDISPTHQGWLVEFSNQGSRYNYVSTEVTVPQVMTDPKTGQPIIDPTTGKPKMGSVKVTESASNLALQNGLIVGRSLSKHWAIAAFLRDNTDPSSNYKNQAQAHVGLEYELVPFLTTNDNALTVSYLIGGNHQTYYDPTIEGKLTQNIATHALSIYYVFHRSRYDVNGSVALTSTVNNWNQWGAGGQLGGRVYINKRKTFTFDPSVSFGYKNNLVNNPANPSTKYEVLQLMGVGNGSTVTTLTFRIGFSYRFGQNLLRQMDTRWQFTSDEVPNNF